MAHSPAERIVAALNEFTVQTRGRCRMWLGIGFEFVGIDRSVLTVRVDTWRDARALALIVEVRNIALMELQDLVPCPALRLISPSAEQLERTVEFVRAQDLDRQLPSSMIMNIDLISEHRARIETQVRAWFDQLPPSSATARAEPIPQGERRYTRIDDLIAHIKRTHSG